MLIIMILILIIQLLLITITIITLDSEPNILILGVRNKRNTSTLN